MGEWASGALSLVIGASRKPPGKDEKLLAGTVVSITESEQKLEKEVKAVGMDFPSGPSGRHWASKLGMSGAILEVDYEDRTVRIDGDVGWCPIKALKGFEDWLPMDDETPKPTYLYLGESFHKGVLTAASGLISQRNLVGIVADAMTLCHYDVSKHPGVKGAVALTIDDAPCRQRSPDKAMLAEVHRVLSTFRAKATFFLCTDFVQGHECGLEELLRDGNEVANHCPEDRSYARDTAEGFEKALLQAQGVCDALSLSAHAAPLAAPATRSMRCCSGIMPCLAGTAKAPSSRSARDAALKTAAGSASKSAKAGGGVKRQRPHWFRSPRAETSPVMNQVLQKHGFVNVLGDCYANDPWITDPKYIGETLLWHVTDGSIIVIHVPEKGFREYNLEALEILLDGLLERGLRAVTLSMLHDLSLANELNS